MMYYGNNSIITRFTVGVVWLSDQLQQDEADYHMMYNVTGTGVVVSLITESVDFIQPINNVDFMNNSGERNNRVLANTICLNHAWFRVYLNIYKEYNRW